MTDPWPEDRVAQLKALWGQGFPAAEIARALGGVTRNAVIGKVHRLGLQPRGNAGTEVRMAIKAQRGSCLR